MEDNNDGWLELEYLKNLESDVFLFLMKINYPLWKLYKFTKYRRLALFIGEIQYTQAERLRNDLVKNNAPYDSIIEDCFQKLKNIIEKNNLCIVLENIKLKNVRGFDFFNAMAFPCFGENLIAISAGVFFLSHTLVRSVEVLLRAKVNGIKPPIFFESFFLNQFVKASLAIICKDHSKTISKIHFIASDDSLLTGIELFCVAHEYSHLLFRNLNYDYTVLNFNKFYRPEIVELILSNEEIAADAFSIIILQHYQRTLNDYSVALYSPQFLFKIFSSFDEIREITKSKSHPSNLERYNYIKKMIDINKYDSFDNVINIIWEKCKHKIKKKYYKHSCFVENNIAIWNEIRSIILEEVNKGN